MKKERILWIDTLKGIGFYFVILGHVAKIDSTLKSWIFSFHMPLFFFATGFTINFEKMLQTPFKEYIARLSKRMLIPYFWLELVGMVARWISAEFITHTAVPVKTYLLGIIYSDPRAITTPSLPLYYVIVLFLAEILIFCLIKLTKNNLGGICFAILALLPISILTAGKGTPWHISQVPAAACMIIIGKFMSMAYYKYRKQIDSMSMVKSIILVVVFVALGALIWKYNGRFSLFSFKYGKDFIVGMVSALFSVSAIGIISMKVQKSKLLKFVGENTFFYMGARPIMSTMDNFLQSFRSPFLYPILLSIAQYLLMVPLTLLVNKYWPYFAGKSLQKGGFYALSSKVTAIVLATFVPYIYLVVDINSAIGNHSLLLLIVEAVLYAVICCGAMFILSRFFPVVFLETKERKAK